MLFKHIVDDTLFDTNKAKLILNRYISCSCSDTINSKIIKKIRKKYRL